MGWGVEGEPGSGEGGGLRVVAGHGCGFGVWFGVMERDGCLLSFSFLLLVGSWVAAYVASGSWLREGEWLGEMLLRVGNLWAWCLATMETSRPCLDFSASAVCGVDLFRAILGQPCPRAERDPLAVGFLPWHRKPPQTVQPRRLGSVQASTLTSTFNARISTARLIELAQHNLYTRRLAHDQRNRFDLSDARLAIRPMVDIEEGATQKRKASPSSPVDDGGSKRPKIEEAQDQGNGVKEYHYGDNSPDRATPNVKTEASSEQLSAPSTERTSWTREELLYPDRRRVIDGERPTPHHLPRKDPSLEEKKRGQRLFGGLLSTLSQTTANPQQKRRMEIQLRQKERASEQRAEDQRRRVEKQRKLDHARRLEQVEFDEQLVRSPPVGCVLEAVLTRAGQMRTRHANMLVLARSLRTKSVPRLVRAKERA